MHHSADAEIEWHGPQEGTMCKGDDVRLRAGRGIMGTSTGMTLAIAMAVGCADQQSPTIPNRLDRSFVTGAAAEALQADGRFAIADSVNCRRIKRELLQRCM
jgi:hypothetical protein